MNQREAVMKVMKRNGGFATLGFLYQEALKVPGSEWGAKDPFASMRRIVQNDKYFFKVKPGLWALKRFKDRLPSEILSLKKNPIIRKKDSDHTYYQGLLVEIGNLKEFKTSIPAQDKNKLYLNKPLRDISTMGSFYKFSYDFLIGRAQTVDVIWFNKRKMPDSFFEIEHTSDIQNSLLKFVELQDFYTKFFIVANKAREEEFRSKMQYNAFGSLDKRVKFLDYDSVSDLHTKTSEVVSLENNLFNNEK